MSLLLLSLATAVQADEIKIEETESGIIAEYTGAPSNTGSKSEITATAPENDKVTTVNTRTAQIEQLKIEVAEILKLSGNETEDELAAKQALAAEKKQQIEICEDEIRRMSGKPQTEAVQKDPPSSGTQRESRRYKELRKTRKATFTGNSSE